MPIRLYADTPTGTWVHSIDMHAYAHKYACAPIHACTLTCICKRVSVCPDGPICL